MPCSTSPLSSAENASVISSDSERSSSMRAARPSARKLPRELATSASAPSASPRRWSSWASANAASMFFGSSSTALRSESSSPASSSSCRRRRHDAVEELLDLRRRQRADELGDDLAVAKRLDGRDALDAEQLRDVRVLVGVDLRQDDLAVAGGGGLLERRAELTAGAAPRGPEVDDDRDLVGSVQYLGLEVGLVHIDDGHGMQVRTGPLGATAVACRILTAWRSLFDTRAGGAGPMAATLRGCTSGRSPARTSRWPPPTTGTASRSCSRTASARRAATSSWGPTGCSAPGTA